MKPGMGSMRRLAAIKVIAWNVLSAPSLSNVWNVLSALNTMAEDVEAARCFQAALFFILIIRS